jgi:hypothetical protein
MKHLNYFKYFEAVIEPFDFDGFLSQLKSGTYNSIAELNEMAKEYTVQFSNFDDFHDSLGTDVEKEMAPKELMLMGGVKFALFNKYKEVMMIVVEEEMFLEFLKGDGVDRLTTFLREVLRHESIHLQQVDRMKDKSGYKLDASPTHNSKKYWTDKKELMAYAQSMIDQLTAQGMDKDEIESKIKNPRDIKSWIWNVYKQVLDPKQMKRFLKYVFQYWEKI